MNNIADGALHIVFWPSFAAIHGLPTMKTWALNTAQAGPQISEISTGSLRANDNNGVSSAHDLALAFLDKALADNGPQSVIYLCF